MKYLVCICEDDWEPGGYLTSLMVYAEDGETAAQRALSRLQHMQSPYWPENLPASVYAVVELPEDDT